MRTHTHAHTHSLSLARCLQDLFLNMDALLPLVIFVIVRARVPRVHAQLLFVQLMLDEDVALGETQMLLTTMLAACEHICDH